MNILHLFLTIFYISVISIPGLCLETRQNLASLIFKNRTEIGKNDNLVVGGSIYTILNSLYICRFKSKDRDLFPGKYEKLQDRCSIAVYPYTEIRNKTDQFEVLTNPSNIKLKWIMRKSLDAFPYKTAIEGGISKDGVVLYIGQCYLYDYVQWNAWVPGHVYGIPENITKSSGDLSMFPPWDSRSVICPNGDWKVLVRDE